MMGLGMDLFMYFAQTYPSVTAANSANSDSVRCFANFAIICRRSWLFGRPKVIIESNRLNEDTLIMSEDMVVIAMF